jgi:hypothetical protein
VAAPSKRAAVTKVADHWVLTQNTPMVLAAKQPTSLIPIVFASAGDPVGAGAESDFQVVT